MSSFAAPAPLHRPPRTGHPVARVLAITALVGAAVALAVVAWQTDRHANELDGRAGAITGSAHRTLVDLLNAETGQRGFLLSGDPVYLRPYRAGSGAANSDLATLTRASGTVPPLAADVAALHMLAWSKLSELTRTISLARSGHRHQALTVVDTSSGRQTMDLVRARVADVERVAARLPLAARSTANNAQQLTLTVDAALVALALALGGSWRLRSMRARRERDRALGELAQEARLERALREVVAAASADGAESDVAAVVAAKVGELLDATTAAVIRAEPESLRIVAYRGPMPYPERLGWDEPSSSARAVRTAKPARVEQYGPPGGPVSEFMAALGLRCGISVPVRMHSRVWGCITVTTTREGGFAPQEERWLERFARLASVALADAQAQKRLRFRARLEEALREVAVASASGDTDDAQLAALVADRLADLLDSKSTSVVRFDPGRLTMLGSGGPEGLPVNSTIDERSVTGRVAQSGTTIMVGEYADSGSRYVDLADRAGAQTGVGVPIFVGGALWGSLGVLLAEGAAQSDAVELLERFAQLTSAALANAEAQARLRDEARLERTLQELSAESASGELDSDDLFALIAIRVAELLDAPAAMVVQVDSAGGTPVGAYGLETVPATLPFVDGTAWNAAWRSGRPARVDDYEDGREPGDGPITPLASRFRSAVAVPLRVHDRRWGSIVVAKADPHSFPSTAEATLERFAGLAAVALAQADTLATLKREATTDGLTGLLNHRAFQQRLREEVARAERHQRPLSLVMFDLDGFKLVNDLHGHAAGDRVLRTVGRVLQRAPRVNDISARVGGDEFAVISPDTSGSDALGLAERLRCDIAAALGELGLPVTLSAGVTDLTTAPTMRDLSHLADSALYHAKHHGRDQAVRYAPGIDDTGPEEDADRRRALGGLTALARAVDAKDSPTQRHSERVATISTELALRLGWATARRTRLREAALLHDVGKIGVPDGILTKPGRLTDQEYERVKSHAQLGAQIAEGVLDSEQLSWVRGHHERPDGRGYPDALTAGNIPDGARLLAIADAYDTMTSGRPYRPPMSPSEAIAEMRCHAGSQFDGELLDLLDQWTHDATSTELIPVA